MTEYKLFPENGPIVQAGDPEPNRNLIYRDRDRDRWGYVPERGWTWSSDVRAVAERMAAPDTDPHAFYGSWEVVCRDYSGAMPFKATYRLVTKRDAESVLAAEAPEKVTLRVLRDGVVFEAAAIIAARDYLTLLLQNEFGEDNQS